MAGLLPDIDESIAFLEKWDPAGWWVLTAIEPSQKRRIKTDTFDAGSEEAQAREWLAKWGASRNVYFHVNPTRYRLDKKAEREDIAALAWMHVDVDPRVGEDLASEQKRILALFRDNLPPGQHPPTCVVFSGGGYQGFWRLKDPMRIDGDPGLYEKAKLYNLQIEVSFGGDSCHNVDRIMRLPGTINRPDERKRKKGRKEALAKVEWWSDNAYTLDQFTPAEVVQSKDASGLVGGRGAQKAQVSGNVARLASADDLGAGVSDQCKKIITQGRDPDEPAKFSSRSEWLWFVVCELVRSKVPDEKIYAVITDANFAISGHILDQDNPHGSAMRHIARAKEHAIHPKLRELNERHAVVSDLGGKCRIISEVNDSSMGQRTRLSFQSAADFKLRYLNQTVQWQNSGGANVTARLGDWWLRHPSRRQYDTIVFAPGMDINGSYNLWKGFAYPARPGNCELFLEHVRANVCAGIDEHYRYLMGWMATAVQNPASPGHTAVVLRGTQGTGKSFFAKTFGYLFGRHFLQVSDPKHLVGSFNAHLRDTVVLFGDEAFYAGDKKHESVLKMLVTEEQITIEAKGVDAHAAPNYVHLIMASNENWVVPAGYHERRFFVLDVTTARRQDNTYFGAIQAQMDDGGYEALLYLLRTYDLTGYDIRALPQTQGLMEQKLLSYSTEKDWWFQKLLHGEVIEGHGWPEYVHSVILLEDYAAHTRTFNLSLRGNATRLGMFLKQCFPDDWESVGQLWGKHMVTVGGVEKEFYRPRVRLVPPLEVCRDLWIERFGGPGEWPKPREVRFSDNPEDGQKEAF